MVGALKSILESVSGVYQWIIAENETVERRKELDAIWTQQVDSNKRGHSDSFWTKTMAREERPVSFSDRQTGSCRWSRIDSTSRRLSPPPPLLHPRRRYPQRVRDYGTKDFQRLRGSNVNPRPPTCFGTARHFFSSLFIYQGEITLLTNKTRERESKRGGRGCWSETSNGERENECVSRGEKWRGRTLYDVPVQFIVQFMFAHPWKRKVPKDVRGKWRNGGWIGWFDNAQAIGVIVGNCALLWL